AGDDPRAHAGPLPQQAEQDVPVADRRGVERDRLAQRQLQDLLRPAAEGEVLGLQPGDDEADAAPPSRLGGTAFERTRAEGGLDLLPYRVQVDPDRSQGVGVELLPGPSSRTTAWEARSWSSPCRLSSSAESVPVWRSRPSSRCSVPMWSWRSRLASSCALITTCRASLVNR